MKYTKAFLKKAHKKSSNHREEIEASSVCGCFYCKRFFTPGKIKEWVRDHRPTALCPHCGIDAVIGNASGLPLCDVFLEKMYKFWFQCTKELK